MPPKTKTSSIYIVFNNVIIDSTYATPEAANARAAELKTNGAPTRVEVQELKGGSVSIIEEKPAQKEKTEPKAKAPKKEKEEDTTPKANTAVKKTKTPAEQRAVNAEKPGKPDDADLPENVKKLLGAMGHVLDGKMVVVTGVPPT